jgi:hypothetical protein
MSEKEGRNELFELFQNLSLSNQSILAARLFGEFERDDKTFAILKENVLYVWEGQK